MVAYLFAGQGSQYPGMGKDLFESFPESRAVFEKADKALGFPLSKLCFEGPKEELAKTNNAQPAILTTSIAAFEAYKVCAGSKYTACDYTAGLSLGEYSALVCAQSIGFEDAVRLVRRRGEFMEEEAAKKPGKMLSVIGLDLAKVQELCERTGTEIANLNCPGQVVISGGSREIESAQGQAKAMGAKLAVFLEVSGAFHSSFMRGASLRLAEVLEHVSIDACAVPVVSNVTALPVVSADEIKANLVAQVASSVLWEASMRFIISKQVTSFVEFGPGKVLKGLMRRIDPAAQVVSVEKKEDIAGVV